MAVQATLDAEGRLHIREQQTIVFNGAWNGGERRFFLRQGHTMRFESIARVGSDGKLIQLSHGKLDRVDRWNYHGRKTIRWRARLPSDPPFVNTPITYILSYTIGNILTKTESGYLLNHDFCFTDREGPVNHFTLQLEFDPVWNSKPVTLSKKQIMPGEGAVYKQMLHFSGSTPPAVYAPLRAGSTTIEGSGTDPAPLWLVAAIFAVLFLFALWRTFLFFKWEKDHGRFLPLDSGEQISREWLERIVLRHKAEVIGATWDKTTASAEVAAVFARLVVEGKLKSSLTPKRLPFLGITIPLLPPVLHLELLVEKNSFSGYEQKLIDGVFVDGGTVTSTEKIKKYYRKQRKTFDPVSKVQEPLRKQMKKLTAEGVGKPGHNWLNSVWPATLAFFILLFNAFYHQDEFLPLQLPGMGVVLFCWFLGLFNGVQYRNSVVRLWWLLAAFFLPILLLLAGFAVLFWVYPSALLLIGLGLLALAVLHNVLNIARTTDDHKGVQFRQQLARARNYLKAELNKKAPDIKDEWFPYLLAFGLGNSVDHWFRRYGSMAGANTPAVSGGTGSGGFTGGGGQFGGGGSSGSWSAAVGSFAASASSSSTGSGGGGSSGGGGGGGW